MLGVIFPENYAKKHADTMRSSLGHHCPAVNRAGNLVVQPWIRTSINEAEINGENL